MLDVRGRLSLDGRAWDSTIRKAEKSAGGLADFVGRNVGPKLAAAFTVGAVAGLTNELAEMSSVIKDNAERLGLSTDSFQEFSHAAQRSGADAAFITTAYEKFVDALQKIKGGETGSDKLLLVLERYGVTLEEINSQDPEAIFRGFADSLKGVTVDGQVTADMIDLLGKSGGKLIPVLRSLKAESEDIKGSFNFMSKEEIEAYDKAGDTLSDLWKATKLGAGRVGIGLKGVFDGSVGELMAGINESATGPENMQKATIIAMERELARRKEEKSAANPKKTDEQILAERKAADKAKEDSEKRAQKLVEDTEKIREESRVSQLTEEERINELLEKREKLEFQIAKAKEVGLDAEFIAQSEHDLAKTESDLNKLQSSRSRTPEVKGPEILRDSLISVGNFLGKTGAQTINTIAQKQLDRLTSIDRHLYTLVERKGSSQSSLEFGILL